MKHIVIRMSSYFPNRWPLSYLNLTKNMKIYIRRQQHKKFFTHKDIKQKEPPQKYRLGTISNTKLLAGPQCHGGCQKFHFREFSVSCFQTSFCARKPLVHSWGSGYPSHPLSILMRLATYLYILYIYVVVLAASWHKS